MTVSVKTLQTRSVSSNNYKVEMSTITSSGITTDIFVKRVSTYAYDRIATVADIKNLPHAPEEQQGYFLDSEFYKEFADVSLADTFAVGVKERIDLLVADYDLAQNTFLGAEEDTFSSP